ncbi:UNVERIFIED_CONTAM: hypothetical protein FKN15_020782 [Acipenser sinensis]
MVTFRCAGHTRSRLLLTLHSPDDNNNNNSSSSDFIQQRPVDPLSLHSGRAKPTALSLNEDTGLNHSCKMDSGRVHLSAQVSRDRVISKFPKWYTPEACLQFKDHFHVQVRNACQDRHTRNVGIKISKVVVVGDLYVGKTCLINRFCKDIFDRDYKATIGVDFEIERFEIAGVPYTLQVWDTAGQEKFKCIASAYYRGAQVIITVFDLADIKTLEHTRQWLEDALKENEPGSCFIFLVGTKKDLVSQAECERTENDAIKMASEMHAEYWSVSAKTGENVQGFFFRLAAIAFEESILKDLEKSNGTAARIGEGDLISENTKEVRNGFTSARPSRRPRVDEHEHDANELQTTPEFRAHVAKKLGAMLDSDSDSEMEERLREAAVSGRDILKHSAIPSQQNQGVQEEGRKGVREEGGSCSEQSATPQVQKKKKKKKKKKKESRLEEGADCTPETGRKTKVKQDT